MVYNAIQMREAIDKLIDRVKSPRFTDNRYYEAINQAIKIILDDRVEPLKVKKDYSVQSTTRLRNELKTLIPPTVTGTIVGNLVSFPADYYYLLAMRNTVNGIKADCKPTTYNEVGTLSRNPFKRPVSDETYYNENNAGWKIELPANASFTVCELDYIKKPAIVSIGNENNKIDDSGVLAIASNYTVYDEAVHNGTTYYEGSTFVASTPVLTSGTVILTSLITNSDMPEYLHEEIIRLAGHIMEDTVENYNKGQVLLNDNQSN